MNWKQTIVLVFYMIMVMAYGYMWGYNRGLNKQEEINKALYEANEELKTNYDILEIQYKSDLDACYTQLGDMQDMYELNGG